MYKINHNFEKNFTVVHNSLINDKSLSLKAKGLFLFMASKNEGWNFTLRSMAKQIKEGVGSISSAIDELKENGYLSYKKNNDGTGIYVLNYQKQDPNPKNPDLPNTENPNLQKPERINNTDLNNNTDLKKTNKEKKDIDFDELLKYLNLKTGRTFRVVNKAVQNAYRARLREGFNKEDIANAIHNASISKHHTESNFRYLTPEFFSRADKLQMYGFQPKQKTEKEIIKEGGHRNF